MGEKIVYIQNPEIDYLFGIFGGKDAPTKKDSFKPFLDLIHVDDDGNETVMNNVYLKNPSNERVREFQEMIARNAKNVFNEKNIIPKPNFVEVFLTFSLTEKRLKIVDVDNLAKVVLDGLTGVAFEDDSQVSSLFVNKHVLNKPQNAIVIAITKLSDSRKGLCGNLHLYSEKK